MAEAKSSLTTLLTTIEMKSGPMITGAWLPERWTRQSERPDSVPLVTIGILSYNRVNELRATLDCITRSVDYPNLEIIVVDNASTDGSAEMIAKEFPSVRTIRLKENIAVSGRNHFYREAKGKYIFSYDDDSMPATPATITQAVELFERHPEYDAISFCCYQPLTDTFETLGLEQFYIDRSADGWFEGLYFVEGGMCVRRDSFAKISGYDPEFHWGAEGADLTLQMYAQGMKTIYAPEIATLHMKSGRNRIVSKNITLFTRNYIWTIAKHFPIIAAIPMVIVYILRRSISALMHPTFVGAYFNGIAQGIGGMARQRKKAKKLSFMQVIGLRRWFMFLYRW